MSWYYISHPDFAYNAKVNAPSTDKARTTFLDYLERSGAVNRHHRQAMRRGMATKKLVTKDDVQADVELDYEYADVSGEVPTFQMGGAQVQEQPVEEAPIEEAQPQQEPMTPIARAVLGSFGVGV